MVRPFTSLPGPPFIGLNLPWIVFFGGHEEMVFSRAMANHMEVVFRRKHRELLVCDIEATTTTTTASCCKLLYHGQAVSFVAHLTHTFYDFLHVLARLHQVCNHELQAVGIMLFHMLRNIVKIDSYIVKARIWHVMLVTPI